MKTQSRIPMFKSKAFNEIRKILRPEGIKGALNTLPISEQFALIQNVINNTCSTIRSYKIDRKHKRKIQEARVARGWKSKQKTSKEDYLAGKHLKSVPVRPTPPPDRHIREGEIPKMQPINLH